MKLTRPLIAAFLTAAVAAVTNFGGLRAQVANPPAQLAPAATFEGVLGVVWGDPHPDFGSASDIRYTLTLADGRILLLQLMGQESEAVLRFGKRVRVSGSAIRSQAGAGAQAAPAIVVESIAPIQTAQAEPAAAVLGSRRVIYLLVRFSDDAAVPHPASFYTDMTNPDTPPSGALFPSTLNGFFKKTSNDQFSWTGDVGGLGGVGAPGGWLTLPHPKSFYAPCGWSSSCANLSALSDDATTLGRAQGIDFKVYDNINFVLSNDLDCCAWAGGYFSSVDGKSFGATWEPPWGQNVPTYAHEMGHSIGLPHSGWVYYAYDSPWDVMSSIQELNDIICGSYASDNGGGVNGLFCGEPGDGYIAAHRDYLGWIPPANEVVTDTASGATVTLEASALPLGSAIKLIKICITGSPCTGSTAHYLTVEARVKGLGATSQFDNAIPGEGVIVHDVQLDRPPIGGPCFFNSQSGWAVPVDATPGDYDAAACTPGGRGYPNYGLYNAQWNPGQTYANGVSISVVSRSDSTFAVTVTPLPGLPIVTTGSALSVTTKAATLNGTVNPNGFATNASFEYGLTVSYGSTTPVQAMGAGSSALAIGGGAIGGLMCATTYHFRATATNVNGTTYGSDASFTTAPCVEPTVTTFGASSVSFTSATLQGIVNPNGFATTAEFEYGRTTAYGSTSPETDVGGGTFAVFVGTAVRGLSCGTQYHFRIRATNVNGTSTGSDATFTTLSCFLPPTVTTGFPTGFGPTAVTLNGTANPNVNATTARFEYGLTAAYGSTTPDQNLGDGSDPVPIGGGGLTGLACGTVYHFRASATNANGTTNGADETFSLPCAEAAPRRYGVVSDLFGAVVIDVSSVAIVATIPLPPGGNFDVAVMPNQSLAFVGRGTDIYVIDLTQNPPALAAGVNPIARPIGSFVEDLSLTADGRFLVVSDGGASVPIGVIDTATRAVVGTFSFLPDHTSVEVCDNGSVLVSSYVASVVKRLTIDATGALTDTGQSLPVSGSINLACAVGGRVGVVASYDTGDLRSFLVDGMIPVSTQVLPGGSSAALNVAISPDGTRLFGARDQDLLTAYDFDSINGAIGSQLWSTNVGARTPYFGVDQIAVHPNGRRVYVSTGGAAPGAPALALALDARDGAIVGSAPMVRPTGIGIPRARRVGNSDYDGDGKADAAVYRPSSGDWFVLQSNSGYTTYGVTPWGVSTDIPVPGDYDGDGRTDLAVYRPSTGTWWVLYSNDNYTTYASTGWGTDTDVPVPGDYDGDGKTDLAVYRPSTGTWWVLCSSTNYATYAFTNWGTDTDIPVPGDYDGDGRADLAVFRPSTGEWWVLYSASNYTTWALTEWGAETDVPVPGDYDGDGKTDLAVYRPSTGTWWVLSSGTGGSTYSSNHWGADTDVPVVADFDGDGKADFAVYRPSTGTWFVLQSSGADTVYFTTSWGTGTDVPLPAR